jgi:hypothetical protein
VTTPPPTPDPDDKDWTWVLDRPCPDCGFDPATVSRSQLPARISAAVGTLAAALDEPAATNRPDPAVWSPLEYGCHVRDVCRIFGDRLQLMLTLDDPLFANWDQDATALESRYWEQDPATVRAELATAGAAAAAAFGAVAGHEWDRPGRRSNGSRFTVATLGTYFLHDLDHHAHDVTA